jgi:hypothetical protein
LRPVLPGLIVGFVPYSYLQRWAPDMTEATIIEALLVFLCANAPPRHVSCALNHQDTDRSRL